MKTSKFPIDGPALFEVPAFSDDRGYFMETFQSRLFSEATGCETPFVQDNQSFSKHKGTVRGLHYQSPPYAQGKLVRCSQGSILDVAVDVRKGSKTYGQHVKAILSAENMGQLWVPVGFLHGFVTLEANTIVCYKCTNYYSPIHDGNVSWSDTVLNIDWGLASDEAHLSPKDAMAPSFDDFDSPFH